MKTSRRRLGDLGEDLACEYLTKAGQQVLNRNWTVGHLEIDIISRDARGLHFVEVKSRVAPSTADPLDNATKAKMARIAKAAVRYAAMHSGNAELFFDIVTVVFKGGSTDITYYPQAYLPMYF
ncbi:MAG: YraN family protein [Bacteroidales bacterium]|nr:YraN family protein [Bacteroidales bacterium]